MTDITKLRTWKKLTQHAEEMSSVQTTDLFSADAARFQKLSFFLNGMLIDFSKNAVTDETLELLIALAEDTKITQLRKAMLEGEKINLTDGRAVLHTAMRAEKPAAEVLDVFKRCAETAENIRSGAWKGHSGKEITDIVSIGIGGSSLGPQLVTEALAHLHHPRLKAHFVSNVEASDMAGVLAKISPETTLFIIASKSFTTVETMLNAKIARQWLTGHYKTEAAVARHFIAASTNAEAVDAFGITPENMFPFRDWVGGRFSVWSPIGLAPMIMAGDSAFRAFMAGAHDMDKHFAETPLERNIPVLMAMIGIWHRNFLGRAAYAVAPYHSALRRLPLWLQQIDMESNGKCVQRSGAPVSAPTGPMVFGEAGTDVQHSFFQWLHQGTDIIPCDFIAAVKTPHGTAEQQDMLLANCLAQSEALMTGKESKEAPHKNFPGNRPSTTILLDELTPQTLGSLMALYEHKVFVQGAVWNINSFDQYGVELGKILAQALQGEISANKPGKHDASTLGLMARIAALR